MKGNMMLFKDKLHTLEGQLKIIKGCMYSKPIMEIKFKEWLSFKLTRHAKRNLGKYP